jgi:hypothetical protein
MTMHTHEFAIVATGLDPEADDFEDRFFEAGCDDATLSFQRGVIIADFAREAVSLEDAIETAIRDVHAAGARVERIEPDHLVNLSDIAERSALSRQAIALYASGERGAGFPTPRACVTTSHPLYDWQEVAQWLASNGKLPDDAVDVARTIKAANEALAEAASGDVPFKLRIRELEAA